MRSTDKGVVYDELATARHSFARLVTTMTPADLRHGTTGTRWTNREMLFHLLFGYIIVLRLIGLVKFFGVLPRIYSRAFSSLLNAAHAPFHLVNYVGSWFGGHLLSPAFMQRRFDGVCDRLARRLETESDQQLGRGMWFPTKWDPFFTPYMTLWDVYRYPTKHYQFHYQQLVMDR